MEIGFGSLDTRYLQEASKPRCTVVFSNGYEEPKLVKPPHFSLFSVEMPQQQRRCKRGEERLPGGEKKRKKERKRSDRKVEESK